MAALGLATFEPSRFLDGLFESFGQVKFFQLAAGHLHQLFAHILQGLAISLKLGFAGPVILLGS